MIERSFLSAVDRGIDAEPPGAGHDEGAALVARDVAHPDRAWRSGDRPSTTVQRQGVQRAIVRAARLRSGEPDLRSIGRPRDAKHERYLGVGDARALVAVHAESRLSGTRDTRAVW